MWKWIVALGLAGGLAVAGWSYVLSPGDAPGDAARRPGGPKGFAKRGGGRGPEAVPLLAAKADVADVPIYLEGLGTARALNTVTVQPLVDGRLLSVNFKEGQDVKRGDVLALIDPTLFQAQLDQAKAKKAQDEAQLAAARRDLDRAMGVGPAATLQKTIDTARGQVESLEALVKADQAQIDTAAAQLGYTQIIAPVDGRTGIRMVDEGNVVRASANSALVMLTQVRPITVLFNLPQQNLGRITAAMAAAPAAALEVEALGPDGRTVIDKGRLMVIDNQVDQTTGTIRLKAEFPNPALQMWPGQFVNVRLLIDTLRRVVAVPTSAVQQGPSGAFVYVIADGTAKVRPVKVGAQDEKRAVVIDGLRRDEVVATTSFARLREGAQVAVTMSEPAADPTVTGAPANADDGKAAGRQRGAGRFDRGERRGGAPDRSGGDAAGSDAPVPPPRERAVDGAKRVPPGPAGPSL